jgi:hypothetical protein
MRERLDMDRYGRKRLGAAWVAVACALLLAAAVAPAEEEGLAPADRPGGRLHGSWLAQVDIGGWFFVQYGVGANAVTGPLNLECRSPDIPPCRRGRFSTSHAAFLTENSIFRRVPG